VVIPARSVTPIVAVAVIELLVTLLAVMVYTPAVLGAE
jgi:hypothetical protein